MPLWDLWSCETLLSCDEPGALRQVGRLRTRPLNRRLEPALRPRPVLALEDPFGGQPEASKQVERLRTGRSIID